MNDREPLITDADLVAEDLERARTIPSHWYTHPDFHAIDRKHVIAKGWHYAGATSRLLKEGDFIAIEIAGSPVIILVDSDGERKAFYNVCKHRGGPLVMEECGHARMLQCKYHGWTYKLDGSLRGVPKFDRTELFDKKDFGLTAIRLAEWEGLLFVNLSATAPPFSEVVSGISTRIAECRIDSLKFHSRVEYPVQCNWKVYVDNYLEGYHLPLVHPELCDNISYADYQTETDVSYSLQHASYRDESDDRAYYYFIFPNTMLNIYMGRLQVNSVIPVGPDETKVIFDYFYPDAISSDAEKAIFEDQAFADRVQYEDIEICEHVQKGLQSEGYDRGRFSVETEAGVHHFQSLLKDSYRRMVSADGQ